MQKNLEHTRGHMTGLWLLKTISDPGKHALVSEPTSALQSHHQNTPGPPSSELKLKPPGSPAPRATLHFKSFFFFFFSPVNREDHQGHRGQHQLSAEKVDPAEGAPAQQLQTGGSHREHQEAEDVLRQLPGAPFSISQMSPVSHFCAPGSGNCPALL